MNTMKHWWELHDWYFFIYLPEQKKALEVKTKGVKHVCITRCSVAIVV